MAESLISFVKIVICKFHILFDFKITPWGGANQFLTGLRLYALKKGQYGNFLHSDYILINSHHNLFIAALARLFFGKIIIHRLDGPISHVRSTNTRLDKMIHSFSMNVSSGIVFQTAWSKEKNLEISPELADRRSITILNVSNSEIFKNYDNNNRKETVVIASWSGNSKKGKAYYEFLDQALPDLPFIVEYYGNIESKFKNIKQNPPVKSYELSNIYRYAKVFLSASKDDPCSNAVIEARDSGLITVCLNSGGHPEITSHTDLLFDDNKSMINNLKKAVSISNYRLYALKEEKCFEGYYKFMVDSVGDLSRLKVINFMQDYILYYAYKLIKR